MNGSDPYNEALTFIRQYPTTGGASSMAKLLLSLYNDLCGYSFAECVSNLDDERTKLAIRLVTDFAHRGETEALRRVGKILADDLYPNLWEMGIAMREAREATRQRWKREDQEREAAELAVAEKSFVDGKRTEVPLDVAKKLLTPLEHEVSAMYFLAGVWTEKKLPVDQVLDAIKTSGTGFTSLCPESSGMLGVHLNGRLYYLFTDYDAREDYLNSLKK